MVINTKVVKDTQTTKLQQVLDAQKEETLTSILALIAAIHNMGGQRKLFIKEILILFC